jgi:hypothetical protein
MGNEEERLEVFRCVRDQILRRFQGELIVAEG